ncbi:MAG TPA: lytic transglycosylase domain-containing protein [Solirubrobacteraceae bacterium]|nr:lytic transglycosylase domain-containing protein [Solirubrobacteraceae bacterium]
MSAQAVAGATTPAATGELAAAQRVQQLQALIEAARQAALPTAATTGSGASYPGAAGADFASALQSATTAGASGVAYPSAVQGGGEGAGAGQYESLIAQAAARNGLDPAVLHGLIQQESGFDPNATSGAGAMGLTQLMPGTASSLGVSNPLNPAESIEGGARYLAQMMAKFGGSTADALAAYNAGPGAVQQYGGIPPYAETQSYVTKVLGNAEAYRQSHPATAAAGVAA